MGDADGAAKGKGRGWFGDPEGHSRAGKKGGAVAASKPGHMSELAHLAGTKAAEDPERMREIGRIGGRARHGNRDPEPPRPPSAQAAKNMATRLGLSAQEYAAKREAGLKWCSTRNHWAAVSEFSPDATRPDGLRPNCRACRSVGGPGTLREKKQAAGRKGGAATAKDRERMASAGKKGGAAIVARHGSEHMAEIGRRGGMAPRKT